MSIFHFCRPFDDDGDGNDDGDDDDGDDDGDDDDGDDNGDDNGDDGGVSDGGRENRIGDAVDIQAKGAPTEIPVNKKKLRK